VRKPLPSPEAGARPSASHPAQSDRGAAPSHWVAAAAVPHQGEIGGVLAGSGVLTPASYRRGTTAPAVGHAIVGVATRT
jgi:hypothetical protein